MRSSELLVKCLEEEGVERIFGIPGEENIDVMDALMDSDIEFILTKHENAAAFMAATCARLTRKAGVCLATLGPGATNFVTGVADAFLSYQPLIALTGQIGAERAYQPQKQYVDLVQLFKPVTKDSFSIRAPSRIPVQMRRAFDLAEAEKPGPVHVELPEDVMGRPAEGAPVRRPHTERITCELSSVKALRDILESSEHPLVLAGAGVLRADAAEELRIFARSWQIPVAHSWLGTGILPYDDALSLGTVGLRGRDFARAAFEQSDTILLVGFDLPEFQPVFWNIGHKKRIVHVDPLPAESVPNLYPDRQVIGDIKSILSRLHAHPVRKGNWAAGIKKEVERCASDCPEGAFPLKPQAIIKTLREALGREDIVVSDVGAHLLWLARQYPVYRENTLLLSNGLIPMGVGVPGAIAAKLVRPERDVVAVVGDGGFMMTSAELETAKRLDAHFVTLIFDDAGFGLIKDKHEKAHGRSYGDTFTNPDFVKYAEAFGAKGYRVGSVDELRSALDDSLDAGETAVIDVPVDYSENKALF